MPRHTLQRTLRWKVSRRTINRYSSYSKFLPTCVWSKVNTSLAGRRRNYLRALTLDQWQPNEPFSHYFPIPQMLQFLCTLLSPTPTDSASDIQEMHSLPLALMQTEAVSKDGRMRLTERCTRAVWKVNGRNTMLGLLARGLWPNRACTKVPEL